MKVLLSNLLMVFTIISTGYGQVKRIYLDTDLRITTKEQAAFYEEWTEEEGILVGSFNLYYASGKLKKEQHYQNEILHGEEVTYYENGQLESKGQYTEGKQNGIWAYWYSGGELKEKITYKIDAEGYTVKVADKKEWHANGKLKITGQYIDGREEGEWTYWYENGKLQKKGAYKKGLKIGNWQEWYENGQLANSGLQKPVYERFPISKRDGKWQFWHKNGKLAELLYYDTGKLITKGIQWYANGQRATEYDFDKGIIINGWDKDSTALVTEGNGNMKHYNSEGKLISMGTYKSGRKVGEWTYYSEDGNSYKENDMGSKLVHFEKSLASLENTTFTIVEEIAFPEGGLKVFYKYVRKNLKYPKSAKKRKLQGKTVINFIVNKEGALTHIKVLKSAGFTLDREAIRIMREAADWKPARNLGKPVKQMMNFPINFRL